MTSKILNQLSPFCSSSNRSRSGCRALSPAFAISRLSAEENENESPSGTVRMLHPFNRPVRSLHTGELFGRPLANDVKPSITEGLSELLAGKVGFGDVAMEDDDSGVMEELSASSWRGRVAAAEKSVVLAAQEGTFANATMYDELLKRIIHVLARTDSVWQVRLAAVQSGTAILKKLQQVLPKSRFTYHCWGVLAVCGDAQPEVQDAAVSCFTKELLPDHDVEILALVDRFVSTAAKSVGDHLGMERISYDRLQDGGLLLAAVTAVIRLQLLTEKNRVPLLVVAAASVLDEMQKTQNKMLVLGLTSLLRSFGLSGYQLSLLEMLDPERPLMSGSAIVRSVRSLMQEETARALANCSELTVLHGLSTALKDWRCQDVSTSDTGGKENSAIRQILKMLQVPSELTKIYKARDEDAKQRDFFLSAHPLLSILKSVIDDKSWIGQQTAESKELVRDLMLSLSTFACGHEEDESSVPWTTNELRLIATSAVDDLAVTLYSSRSYGQVADSSKTKGQLVLGLLYDLLLVIQRSLKYGSKADSEDSMFVDNPHDSTYDIVLAHQMTWILKQVGHPHLGQHCQTVMPCVLTALDHYSPPIKREAMKSFLHLSENMDPSELRWYKDVILDAVCHNIAGNEELWSLIVRMAVSLVTRIEGRNSRSPWYRKILIEMFGQLERHVDDKNCRIVWLEQIGPQLEAMGLVLVAHFKRLFSLLFYWLQNPDEPTCTMVLSCLRLVIKNTWPRVPYHASRIWEELVKLYLKVNDAKVRAAIVRTASLLIQCVGPRFQIVWEKHQDNPELVPLIQALKQCNEEAPNATADVIKVPM